MDQNEARASYEAEMQTRRHLAENLPEAIENAMEIEGFLAADEKGALMGLALDVKPAVFIATAGDLEAVKEELIRWGSNFQLVGDLVVNKRALLKSMAEQSDVAEEFGWDFTKSLEENLAKVSTNETGPNQYRALTGLVLGYPEKAVRDFARANELLKAGIPRPYDFFNVGSNTGSEQRLSLDNWDAEDIQLLKKMSRADREVTESNRKLLREERVVADREYRSQMIKENAQLLRGWYKKYFNASPEDANFLLSLHGVIISTPDGKPVYTYVESSQGDSADTADLRMKVGKAFHEVGL